MTDPVTAAFASSLKRLRREQGLSRHALAGRSGVSDDSIRNLENGMSSTVLLTAGKLAKALGSSVPEMIRDGEAAHG